MTAKTYGYDSENKLTSASAGVTLSYDPLDRLASVVTSSATRKFLYAPGDSGLPEAIEEIDGSYALVSLNAFGPGPDEPLAIWDASIPVWRALHADERGSIIALSYGSASVTNVNRYDEYGTPQSGNFGRFQYTGQMYLPEAGVYHYRARAYAPQLGRFLQPDPIGYADSANLYPYVGNDPINATDPWGLAQVGEIASGATKPIDPIFVTADISIGAGLLLNTIANIAGPRPSNEANASLEGEPIVITAQKPKPKSKQCAAHPILGALGKLWSSPNTVLGLAAAGASYAAGKIAGSNPMFATGNNSIQLLNSPINVNNRAYTLGNVQVYGVGNGPDRSQTSYTGAFVNNGSHEEGHSVQAQFLGPLFLPVEAIGSLFGNRNPLEVGADKYGTGGSCSGF